MNPSPSAVDWIRGFIASIDKGGSLSDLEIVEAANREDLPNPSPRGVVPLSWKWPDLVAILSPATTKAILSLPIAPLLIEQMNGDTSSAGEWVSVLAGVGLLSAEEIGSIQGLVVATSPDPSWRPMISRAEAGVGRKIDADDISEARR